MTQDTVYFYTINSSLAGNCFRIVRASNLESAIKVMDNIIKEIHKDMIPAVDQYWQDPAPPNIQVNLIGTMPIDTLVKDLKIQTMQIMVKEEPTATPEQLAELLREKGWIVMPGF